MTLSADPSFDIHPNTKGSYRRRAEDIDRALRRLRINQQSREAAFLLYYFACEKLAKIIIGISNKEPASQVFGNTSSLHLHRLSASCRKLDYPVSEVDLHWIFLSQCEGERWERFVKSSMRDSTRSDSIKSARWLRNKTVHDIGPTHSALIAMHADFLILKMKNFLSGTDIVVQVLESKEER